MKARQRLTTILLAFLTASLLLGCGDDEVTNPRQPGPLPLTEDSLMTLFKQAYGDMNVLAYEKYLHAGYEFVFSNDDVINLGLPDDHLDKSEEIDIAANMFSGVVGPTGEPAIATIRFVILEPVTNWQDSDPQSRFPNSRRRVYNIAISMDRPGNTTFQIEGQQEFFAVSNDSTLPGGDTVQVWRLIGQIDRSWAAKSENSGWGQIKALYWDRPF